MGRLEISTFRPKLYWKWKYYSNVTEENKSMLMYLLPFFFKIFTAVFAFLVLHSSKHTDDGGREGERQKSLLQTVQLEGKKKQGRK